MMAVIIAQIMKSELREGVRNASNRSFERQSCSTVMSTDRSGPGHIYLVASISITLTSQMTLGKGFNFLYLSFLIFKVG